MFRYGPPIGERTGAKDPDIWAKVRNAVSRRERVHKILVDDFHGNQETFFKFFTVDDTQLKTSKGGKPRMPRLVAFRQVCEAISKCKKDVDEERDKSEYIERGEFSMELWATRWGERNDWEVWRELGKERYTK